MITPPTEAEIAALRRPLPKLAVGDRIPFSSCWVTEVDWREDEWRHRYLISCENPDPHERRWDRQEWVDEAIAVRMFELGISPITEARITPGHEGTAE